MPKKSVREVGWCRHTLRDGIVAPCVMCGDPCSKGVVALHQRGREGEEGFRIMCDPCYTDVSESSSETELLERRKARSGA